MRAGDLDVAQDHAEKITVAAEKSRNLFHCTTAMFLKAQVSVALGDWDLCREYLSAGLERSPTEIRLLNLLLGLESTLGNDDAITRLRREYHDVFTGSVNRRALIATALYLGGTSALTGSDKPLDDLETVCSAIYSGSGDELLTVNMAQIGLANVAIARADKVAAEDLFRSPRVPWDRIVGLPHIGVPAKLGAFVGEVDWAIDYFEAQLAVVRPPGYRPSIAGLVADYAEVLIDRDAPGDREKATDLQDEAIAIAHELGMQPLLVRVLAQREILKA